MGLFKPHQKFNDHQTFLCSTGYLAMDPFNIRIVEQGQHVTLTVLPTESGYFKIIYYAAIFAAVQRTPEGHWALLPKEDIEAGDLPFYVSGKDPDQLQPTTDEAFAKSVGSAIDLALQEQN